MDQTKIFGKAITVAMLSSAIDRGCEFEFALGEVAQELNEALANLDYSGTKEDVIAVIEAARRAVSMIEKAAPGVPLRKPQPMTDEDVMWEWHLMRGIFPGGPDAVCDCSYCKGK